MVDFTQEQLSAIGVLADVERHRCQRVAANHPRMLDRARLMDTIVDRAEGLLLAAIVEPEIRFIRASNKGDC